MSSDPLSGPKLKVQWANERIGEIDQISNAYLNGNHYAIVVEPGLNPDDRLAKIKTTAPVPDALYMLIGEVAYHLRSSLDQMILAIARANGVANARNLYFPFAKDRRGFESASTHRKMRGLPPDVINMIAELEPFHR